MFSGYWTAGGKATVYFLGLSRGRGWNMLVGELGGCLTAVRGQDLCRWNVTWLTAICHTWCLEWLRARVCLCVGGGGGGEREKDIDSVFIAVDEILTTNQIVLFILRSLPTSSFSMTCTRIWCLFVSLVFSIFRNTISKFRVAMIWSL